MEPFSVYCLHQWNILCINGTFFGHFQCLRNNESADVIQMGLTRETLDDGRTEETLVDVRTKETLVDVRTDAYTWNFMDGRRGRVLPLIN